jgi:hypothetical protein
LKVALIFTVMVMASLTVPVSPLFAITLSRDQAAREVDRLLQKRSGDASRHVRLTEVLGCLPAFGEPDTVWVCPVMVDDFEHPLEFTFVDTDGIVTARENDAEAACPSLQVAEKALRQIENDPALRVRSEIDDGKGLFTSGRGILRDEKGSYRLMCRYEIANAVFDDRLYLTYVWYGPAGYIIDTDVERW